MSSGALTLNMSIHWQLLRYTIVGLSSNVALYAGYLLATSLGMGHKAAMTLLYATGILVTFLFNRHWTFRDRGNTQSAFIRYIVVYGLGYLVNFAGLYLFVDQIGYRLINTGCIGDYLLTDTKNLWYDVPKNRTSIVSCGLRA